MDKNYIDSLRAINSGATKEYVDGLEDFYPKSPGNYLRDVVGADRMSKEEMDDYYANLPLEMGMAGMGSIKLLHGTKISFLRIMIF